MNRGIKPVRAWLGSVPIAIVAVVIAAWFVLGARQAHQLARATALVQAPMVSARQARQATDLLASAATLNPDRQVEVLRAGLAVDRGQRSRARHMLVALTRAEPQSLVAWYMLAQVGGNGLALEARALQQITRLDPPQRIK